MCIYNDCGFSVLRFDSLIVHSLTDSQDLSRQWAFGGYLSNTHSHRTPSYKLTGSHYTIPPSPPAASNNAHTCSLLLSLPPPPSLSLCVYVLGGGVQIGSQTFRYSSIPEGHPEYRLDLVT